MLPLDPKSEIKALTKRIAFLQIVDAPGMILIGLGLFGKFGDSPEGLHPLLANADFTTGMIVVGGVIAGWCLLELLKAMRRRAELARQLDT